jgi:hypothetical protein
MVAGYPPFISLALFFQRLFMPDFNYAPASASTFSTCISSRRIIYVMLLHDLQSKLSENIGLSSHARLIAPAPQRHHAAV